MQTVDRPQSTSAPVVTWDPLPDDFVLPDDPVDNLLQPLLAAVLREILELAGLITPDTLIATNFGLCATVNGKTVVKAPDWVYAKPVPPLPDGQIRRSYTPNRQGAPVSLVMEFMSETEGSEYSVQPTYPYGKWWFYERILQVPQYFIFWPETGSLEGYELIEQRYEPQPSVEGRYWVEPLSLFVGAWQGEKAESSGYWLRWWDEAGNLLPWGTEKVALERQRAEQEHQRAEQERQRAEQEHQRAEQEHQRAEQLAERLRALGIDPDALPNGTA